jgi:hypothetical protein
VDNGDNAVQVPEKEQNKMEIAADHMKDENSVGRVGTEAPEMEQEESLSPGRLVVAEAISDDDSIEADVSDSEQKDHEKSKDVRPSQFAAVEDVDDDAMEVPVPGKETDDVSSSELVIDMGRASRAVSEASTASDSNYSEIEVMNEVTHDSVPAAEQKSPDDMWMVL